MAILISMVEVHKEREPILLENAKFELKVSSVLSKALSIVKLMLSSISMT